jgi:hypothetical protein
MTRLPGGAPRLTWGWCGQLWLLDKPAPRQLATAAAYLCCLGSLGSLTTIATGGDWGWSHLQACLESPSASNKGRPRTAGWRPQFSP